MAPKRVKSGTTAPAAVGNKTWEAGLTSALFEEESWQANISLVVGERPEDEELSGALGLAVQQPLRRLFSLVSWENTLEKINELGNPKSKKTKDTPAFYEVLEAAKALLDAGEQLSCDLLGQLLKFQLLVVKASDQQRRRAAEEKAMGKAGSGSTKERGAARPSAKGDKGKKASEPSPPAKDTKLKRRGEEDETSKYIDDEPDDGPQHYILVVGFHQAQLPAVLESLGVHVSNVIQLSSGGTHTPEGGPGDDNTALDEEAEAVLHRKRRELEVFWAGLGAGLDGGPALSKLHDVARLRHTTKHILLPQDRDSTEAVMAFGTRVFDEVACLIYDSLDWRRQHQHYLSNMRLIQVPSVCRALSHRGQDSPAEAARTPTPQIPGSKKKSAPEETSPDPEAPPLTTEVDMRYYSDLLDLVPPEASSVPLILNCMLEQVLASEQALPPLSVSRTQQRADGLDQNLADYMLSSILTLPLPGQDKTRLQEELGVEQSSQQRTEAQQRPLLFNSHDHRALRLQQLPVCQDLDAVQAEAAMMRRSPVWTLLNSSSSSSSSTRQARTQQLVHYCTDASQSWVEVECVFRQCVFESIPLTRLDDQGVLTATGPPEPVLIPWDDPVAFAKHLRRLRTNTQGGVCAPEPLSVADIRSSQLRDLTDWHCAEHHPANVLPQVLQSASEMYRCLDTFRSSLDSALYVICHNPMSQQRQCKEFWDMALHTDVGFRNYLEHVADSISDWTKEEEVKWLAEEARREAEQLRSPAPSVSSERGKPESGKKKGNISPQRTASSPVKSLITEEGASEAYIREDSLKAWKLEQERLKEEEQVKKVKKDKGGRGSVVRGAERADSSRENKKTPEPPKKSTEDPGPLTAPPRDEAGELQLHGEAFTAFTGYSMEGKLIQVSGQVQSLFPSDGGRIHVETIHFVQGSSLIKVCVMKDQHHFYTHISQPIREPKELVAMENGGTRPANGSVTQGSFSALLANGVHLSYTHYGPTGEHTAGHQDAGRSSEVDLPSAVSPVLSPSPSKKLPQPSPPSCSEEGQPVPNDSAPVPKVSPPPFHNLSLSTPSGLLLEFLRDTDGVMVRQSSPLRCRGRLGGGGVSLADPALPREMSRVVTTQGAVVKYMRDGSTQVLFADGSVSSSPDSGPVFPLARSPPPREEEPATDPAPEVKDTEDKKGKLNSKQTAGAEQVEPKPSSQERLCSPAQRQEGCWVTTTPSGLRVSTQGNTHTSAAPALAYRATDPITHTVVVTREDQVLTVLEPDGTTTVEHADGTRITTLRQQRALAQTRASTHSLGGGATGEGPQSSRESAESVCEGEKVVMVEREGYATVVMYPEENSCHLFLGDGTVLTASPPGVYQVFPSSEGLLVIKEDGSSVYTPDTAHSPNLTFDPGQDPALTSESLSFRHQPGSYLMSHTGDITCEVIDPDGNLFQVMVDGQTSVVIARPAPQAEEDRGREEGEEEERELARHAMGLTEQCPRLFLVHEDGSGTELLSSQTVEELLYQAYSDSTIALLKEPVPDLDGAEGITVLKPCHQSVWSSWLMHKQNQDIIPTNLKPQTWDRFPTIERKTPGPAFGTSLGRGLCLRDRVGPPARGPVLSCPAALEVRRLVTHQPVTPQLRSTLETRLKDYMQQVVESEQLSERMLLKDPRTEEERIHANDLLKLVLSLPDSEGPSYSREENTPKTVDIATLYSQAVAPGLQNDAAVSKTSHRETDSEGQQESLWPNRIQQHRQELSEERLYREALRNRIITPYFHPDPSEEVPDMKTLSQDLPPFPQTGQSESFLRDVPQKNAQRPLNPTPSHAAGSDAPPVGRPTNPTPQTAGDGGSSVQPSRVRGDVAGPSRSQIKLPSSILSSKPCRLPNQQFLSVEEPVRRKGRTVSVIGQRPPPRGFELLPSEVTFGSLREGSTYAVTVVMRNVGVDTCRFSVKQPSPSTGLRVMYSPGPVAAGMKVDLQVQLFAMAAGEEGGQEEERGGGGEVHLSHHILIHTETETLYLPVSAIILPGWQYDDLASDRTNWPSGRARVCLLSDTPPVRLGVVLPLRPATFTSTAAAGGGSHH